jgi:predicted dehydrogenase
MFAGINTAVAGTGFIGPVHVEALRRLGINVTGILGSTPEKSRKAAEVLGLKRGYHHYEEILADSSVHAVHIATPNVAHYSMVKQALLAGKHVMCEKPLAMTSLETLQLTELAEKSGLVAGVTYNLRYYPMNLEAKMCVVKGEVGNIYSVVGSYVQDWLLYDTDYNWRVLADKGGQLRTVADIGTHWMDLIHSITGLTVASVFAHLSTVHASRWMPVGEVETFTRQERSDQERKEVKIDTEDCGSILFKYKQGGQGVLWVSQVTAGLKNRIRYEIAGSEKSLSWDSDRANQLLIGYRNKSNEWLEKDPSLNDPATAEFINYPGGHSEGFPDTFKQCFRAFYNAIIDRSADQEISFATFADGHAEVRLCEAILQSDREGRWIPVFE